MSKKPEIIWEKWYSPFGEDDLDAERIAEEAIDEFLQSLKDDADTEDAMITSPEQAMPITRHLSKQKFMITPMGVMPLTENTDSGKIFNFWIGHTNFDITKDIASIIESCDGVESLDIFTRYRFRISIGKAFADSETMYDINTQVYNTL